MARKNQPLPPLNRHYFETRAPADNSFDPVDFDTKLGKLTIQLAKRDEVCEVKELFRQMAEQAEGFGIDEFDKHGIYSRKLFYDSQTFVVKTDENQIAAVGIFGASKLGRSKDLLASSYVIVKNQFRRAGIATYLITYFKRLAKEKGFEVFIQDVLMLAANYKMIDLLQKQRFKASESLPKCAL